MKGSCPTSAADHSCCTDIASGMSSFGLVSAVLCAPVNCQLLSSCVAKGTVQYFCSRGRAPASLCTSRSPSLPLPGEFYLHLHLLKGWYGTTDAEHRSRGCCIAALCLRLYPIYLSTPLPFLLSYLISARGRTRLHAYVCMQVQV